MERLVKITGSALGRSIEKEIQHLCDIRDNCIRDDKVIVKTVQSVVPQVLQRLHKLIQSHFPGCTFDLTNNEYYAFYTDITAIRHDITDLLTPQGFRKTTLSPKTSAELIKISEQFKVDTIAPQTNSDDRIVGIRFKLSIDFINTLCSEHVINSKLPNFTAEELTAIILHELGHVLSFYKQLQFTKRSLDIQKEHFHYFFKNASNTEKLKFIKYTANNKVLDSLPLDQKQAMIDSADMVEGLLSRVTTYAGDALKNAFDFFVMFFYLFECLAILSWVQSFIYQIVDLVTFIHKTSSQPDHDYAWADRFYSDAERAADSWCVKNGYAVPLTTANLKIKELLEYKMFNCTDVRSGAVKYYTSKFVMFFINFATAPGFDYIESYEQGINRYRALQYENIRHLKNADIPDELASMYIHSIQEMDRELDKLTFTKISTATNNIVKTIYRALSPAKWAEHLTYGTMFADLSNLASDINKLQNNRLYASAAELKLMNRS